MKNCKISLTIQLRTTSKGMMGISLTPSGEMTDPSLTPCGGMMNMKFTPCKPVILPLSNYGTSLGFVSHLHIYVKIEFRAFFKNNVKS